MTSTVNQNDASGLVCPECGGDAIEKPPREWITRTWEPTRATPTPTANRSARS